MASEHLLQQKTILRATRRNPRDHLIYSLTLGTGLQLAEIVSLNVGDVYTLQGVAKNQRRLRPEIANGILYACSRLREARASAPNCGGPPMLPRGEAMQRRAQVVQLLRLVKAYGPHLTSRCPKGLHAQERSHLLVDVHPILYHGGEKRISVRGACRCTPWKIRMSDQKRCAECVTSPTDLDAWVRCPVCKRPGQETLVAFHHMPWRTICWACFIGDPGREFKRTGN